MTFRRTWGLAARSPPSPGSSCLPACNRRKAGRGQPDRPVDQGEPDEGPPGERPRGHLHLDRSRRARRSWTRTTAPSSTSSTRHDVMLFEDDHAPVPPPSTWEPGKTYSYTRTRFVPVYPYVGDVEVRMGLYPHPRPRRAAGPQGRGPGFREYKVAKMELLPQTENIFLVYKEGWHNPETQPENPSVERTWTKKEALVSFKNPKKDVIVYLQADTCVKCFPATPELTVSVGNNVGLRFPIDGPAGLPEEDPRQGGRPRHATSGWTCGWR